MARSQIRLWHLMVGVLVVALLAALVRFFPVVVGVASLLLAFGGPICGALIHRRMGRKGVTGGVVGGAICWGLPWVVAVVVGAFTNPGTPDLTGAFQLVSISSLLGITYGLYVGMILWATSPRTSRSRQDRSNEPTLLRKSRQIVLLHPSSECQEVPTVQGQAEH